MDNFKCNKCGTEYTLPPFRGQCNFCDDGIVVHVEAIDQYFFERELGNLLAILHRDGGHYITEHGWLKAVKDAKAIAADMVVR